MFVRFSGDKVDAIFSEVTSSVWMKAGRRLLLVHKAAHFCTELVETKHGNRRKPCELWTNKFNLEFNKASLMQICLTDSAIQKCALYQLVWATVFMTGHPDLIFNHPTACKWRSYLVCSTDCKHSHAIILVLKTEQSDFVDRWLTKYYMSSTFLVVNTVLKEWIDLLNEDGNLAWMVVWQGFIRMHRNAAGVFNL